MSSLDLTQWEDFAKKAWALDKACFPFFVEALTEMSMITVGELREYPPATEANQPGRVDPLMGRPVGYYERGAGWWYPIYKSQAVTGKRLGIVKHIPTLQGYKLRRSSELLAKRWAQTVIGNQQAGFVEAVVGNNASYADFVQGERQADFHAGRGWETVDAAVEKLDMEYDEILSKMIDDVVAYMQLTGRV